MPNNGFTEDLAGKRIPPHSLEAEQAVIGGLLLDPAAWDKIADLLFDNDFYHQRNKVLFTAIRELAERGQPLDLVTVSDTLKKAEHKDEEIFHYLSTLAVETPSAANIKAYADIVHRNSVKRQLITAANTVLEHAYDPANQDSQELLNDAEQLMFGVSDDSRKTGDFRLLKDLSVSVYKQVEERSKSDQTITGVATGFKEIDEKTSGLQKGDLIIIAGRPSMGKTSLALNIAEHAAVKEESGAVAVFSMEMSAEQVTDRFYSSLAKINQTRLRNGQLNADEWTSLTAWHQRLSDIPIYINDTSTLTPVEICSQVRRLKRERDDLALVIVDYLQLMHIKANTETRAVEIAAISRALKGLAREVDVPLIALSQLNRNIESRPERKPQMSDLRESGAIEQDADLIMVIYHDGGRREDQQSDNVVSVEVVKQRNGPTFKTKLTFIGQYTRFENYIPEEAIPDISTYREAITTFDQMTD